MLDYGVAVRLPEFLESFENLAAHFDEHFDELGSNERGDTFLDLALKVLSLSSEGQAFPTLRPSEKKSHDGGVDIYAAQSDDGRILGAQSKYKVRGKEDFDSIISKFKDYEASRTPQPQEPTLFPLDQVNATPSALTFALCTSSKLEGIIARYKTSTLASVDFYRQLLDEGRFFYVDGPRILIILQNLYKKTHLIPSNIVLRSLSAWHESQGVSLGTVSGADLVELYEKHGDALFFENIRDFLGTTSGRVVTTRSTVNEEIIKTIKTEPLKMLARNNGVTFRATEVVIQSDGTAELSMAAIVNGCQTTMCLVHCSPVAPDCLVQVKVVQTTDAWDIAKAANYQNPVTRVDLDLARYLRPQLVRRVALALGYAVETDTSVSASSVLNTIYRTKVDYEELRTLVLGLFSRQPNNLFEANYTELRGDVLEELYDEKGGDEAVFGVLLLLLKESRQALENCAATYSGPEYAGLFKRFYNDDRPRYRVYFAISAICALLRDDLSTRSIETAQEVARMRSFLLRTRTILENDADPYHEAFLHAFLAIADSVLDIPSGKSDTEISLAMFKKISGMAFSSVHKKVLMRIDAEEQRARRRNEKKEPKT